MMESAKPFTQEAEVVLENYLSEVTQALSSTELSEKEVNESIEELRAHIVGHCEMKVSGDVITTDAVKASIKKLGDPKTISETLQSELDFTAEVRDEQPKTSTSAQRSVDIRQPHTLGIKARHISAIYAVLSWAITANIIFVLYDVEFFYLAESLPYIYLLAIGLLIATRNIDAYAYNRHLQQHVKPNFHTNISPVLFVLAAFGLGIAGSISTWVIPAIIVLWLLLSSTDYGLKYYYTSFQQVRDIIEDK